MSERKRYMLFAFDAIYPFGGYRDVRGSFDSVEEAKNTKNESPHKYEYWELLDLDTGQWEAL